MERRKFFELATVTGATSLIPNALFPSDQSRENVKNEEADFLFCLNTSTISGQQPGLLRYIEIASDSGYDGIELWVRDVKQYIDSGNKASTLRQFIYDHGITVENAIGFAPWLSGDDGMNQMKQEMEIMGSIGCKRIAAPVMGLKAGETLDLFQSGEKYRALIELGLQTGVKPLLEFWGSSKALYHIGQAMMVAAVTNHPEASILADVFHMFRGDSGFETLKMLNGNMIDIFHMNDYVTSIPRDKQTDSDRVYPGDGAAPMTQIISDLINMGGTKVLSLELFNKTYWTQPAEVVAKTGLEKMKELVSVVS
jgi:sugar phosphate isomerase/epimerase